MWTRLSAHRTTLLISALSGTSAAAGVAVGYAIANRRLSKTFEERIQTETDEIREFYANKARLTVKAGELATAEDAAKALIDYAVEHPVETEEVLTSLETSESEIKIETDVVNIFSSSEVLTEEDAMERENSHVYVITQSEFLGNESGYENTTLTYYEGDDVLCDSDDTPIQDTEKLVGSTALERFGHGTSDANQVHIRNDNLELDIEVYRSNGKYVVEVLGMDDPDELKHGEPRRFRRYDD